jgi:hypothetical protein
MDKKQIQYSGVILDESSHEKLINRFTSFIPEGWEIFTHHMTIVTKGLPEELKGDLGKLITLTVEAIGVSDMAIAVKVSGYPSKNDIPHVTLAVNPEGGKPHMSNQIKNWCDLSQQFKIAGTIREITN